MCISMVSLATAHGNTVVASGQIPERSEECSEQGHCEAGLIDVLAKCCPVAQLMANLD